MAESRSLSPLSPFCVILAKQIPLPMPLPQVKTFMATLRRLHSWTPLSYDFCSHCRMPFLKRLSKRPETNKGLKLMSRHPSGPEKRGLLSGVADFPPPIDAVPQCLGQGSEGQAENLWSDILGCLLVLGARWLGSKAGFPGLAVWGVCPGSGNQSASHQPDLPASPPPSQ